MRTVLVDYDAGNLHSAEKAFQRMARETGAGEVIISNRPEDVLAADRVVLPGDGAFPACKAQLMDLTGLFDAIEEVVIRRARPFLGICVGMQMLASKGLEYHEEPGFDWIGGTVERIQAPGLKIPHMGWNDLVIEQPHRVLAGIETGQHAYFVHSYHFHTSNPLERLAFAEYGGPVTAIVGRDNIIGVQFHPEKSQAAGLRLIGNFLTWAP